MKKILTLLLALILAVSLSVTAFAATGDYAGDLLKFNDFYAKKKTLTSFEETVALASVEQMAGITPFIPESDGGAESLSTRILARIAVADTAKDFNEPNELKALQGEDGSFGETDVHCYAMLALSAANKINGSVTYASGKAYESLRARQKEDGSFDGDVTATALAIAVLACSDSPEDRNAKTQANGFLRAYKAKDCVELCWQIIGLADSATDPGSLIADLKGYRLEDGSFTKNMDGTQTDEQATALALIALNAANQSAGAFRLLAQNGKLTKYKAEDFRFLIILVVVLVAASAIFWLVVILHKKHDKTLEETKRY